MDLLYVAIITTHKLAYLFHLHNCTKNVQYVSHTEKDDDNLSFLPNILNLPNKSILNKLKIF